MKPATRKSIIGLLLAATAAAALWPLPDDDAVVSPRLGKQTVGKGLDVGLSALHPLNSGRPVATNDTPYTSTGIAADLFPSQTWTPPPSPQQETVAVAPPLPFTFGGRYVEAGKTLVFLMEGERVHSVRVGDTINGAYRIDAIEPAAVQLTYLPLNTRQSLPTGSITPQ